MYVWVSPVFLSHPLRVGYRLTRHHDGVLSHVLRAKMVGGCVDCVKAPGEMLLLNTYFFEATVGE